MRTFDGPSWRDNRDANGAPRTMAPMGGGQGNGQGQAMGGGLLRYWYGLTAAPAPLPAAPMMEHERGRRSRLTSSIILGILVTVLVLLPVGSDDVGSRIALLAVTVGLAVAAVLNRNGLVTLAGTTLVLVLCGAVVGAVVSQPKGLTIDAVSAYSLFVIAVAVAASILPRPASFLTAGLAIALICLDFFLQPHNPDLEQDLHKYSSVTVGTLSVLSRPIALMIIVAVISYLWARGFDGALRRADRAEVIAELERRDAERTRELEEGVRDLLAAHVQVANGNFNVRASLARDNLLWQIGNSLNTLIARMSRMAQTEFMLQRTQEEAHRLALALQQLRAGRQPIWPAASGTPMDEVLEALHGTRLPAPRPAGEMSPNSRPNMQAPGAGYAAELPEWLRLSPPGGQAVGGQAVGGQAQQNAWPEAWPNVGAPAEEQWPNLGGADDPWRAR